MYYSEFFWERVLTRRRVWSPFVSSH